MNSLKFTLFIVGILLLGGCTYNVHPLPMKQGMVENFQSQLPIRLVNVQNTGIVKIAGAMGDKVNLNKTTDAAITLFRDELIKRGVELKDDTSRFLNISIEELYVQTGFWGVRCTTLLSVETGGGLKVTVKEYDVSGIAASVACNFAVTKVVAAALNNRHIHNYITEGSNTNISNQEKLIELKRMLDIGLLTNDEYDKKREDIMGNL